MKIRDVVGGCLEMAQAEDQQFSIREQATLPGEKAKVIAAARCLPPRVLDYILKWASKDTLPVLPGTVAEKPLAYGCESVTYPLSSASGAELVFKAHHVRAEPWEWVRQSKANQVLLEHYLGNIATPTHYLVYESPYHTGQLRVGSVQPKIEGVCFFAHPELANDQSVLQLDAGVLDMNAREGVMPDLNGRNNVLVDANGDIHLVDCSFLMPLEKAETLTGFQANLATLAAEAERRVAVATPQLSAH